MPHAKSSIHCEQHSEGSSAQVGSILNFSLMYFLAPVASAAAAGQSLGLLQKITGPHFLSKWGAPAGHFFEPGFPASKRLVNFLYKVGDRARHGLIRIRSDASSAWLAETGGSCLVMAPVGPMLRCMQVLTVDCS